MNNTANQVPQGSQHNNSGKNQNDQFKNFGNMTRWERFLHKWNVFLGREKKIVCIRRKMPQEWMHGQTKVTNLGCIEEGISFEKREHGWYDKFLKACTSLAVLVKKLLILFAICMVMGLGILALREVVPGVANQVAPLYEFMDQYAVPTFNSIMQKVMDFLASNF